MKKPAIFERLERSLETRKSDNRLRKTAPYRDDVTLDLSTNSYLALETNRAVAAYAGTLAAGYLAGNLASRLISTSSKFYETLEKELAEWKQTESVLLFNSGYVANLGILQACANRDTEIYSDRLNHASIVDGIRLSGARMIRYRHCDVDDLVSRLKKGRARDKIIVTDSVFSMDGDRAPLSAIADIAEEHGCLIMVDEAHATGVLGPHGAGLIDELSIGEKVHIRMGTMSKALAGLGGFFAGSSFLREYLVNTARSLVYSTALPHAVLAHDLAAVRHIRAAPQVGTELQRSADWFRHRLHELGFDTLQSTTQIVPCVLGSDTEALDLSKELLKEGIKAPAIRPPTVPAGTSRIRFSLTPKADRDELERVLAVLKRWSRR